MFRVAYVNGRYLPHDHAAVHVEDRGYQFADAVYEVCEIYDGRLLDERRHMQRLERSLAELRIPMPLAVPALGVIMREVARRNRVTEGLVYIQVSRGVAPRDHPFPTMAVRPALVVTARSIGFDARDTRARKGVAVVTAPDIRWGRVDIKTVGLLPNVLAKQGAREQGAYEAWLVDRDGNVTEGASTNAWIVNAKGVLVTRHADAAILRGVTRMVLLDVATRRKVSFEERPFSVSEALSAREAFLTSATNGVMPIVKIDGKKVGAGKPGPVATALRAGLIAAQSEEAGAAKV
ncbi:MAG TPA: D-amino-acid transaminase [Bauldia sp.]|nr:D-amino-acid transaminase [Bauldia sp.]